MKLYIISGLSGSGKSVALHTLEDIGFYCIDNLPLSMLAPLALDLQKHKHPAYKNTAVGIDARNLTEELQQINSVLSTIKSYGIDYKICFLIANKETLFKRFSETRRRHPLTQEGHTITDAIAIEMKRLSPIADTSDLCIDTSNTSIHQLRSQIRDQFIGQPANEITVQLKSFGFKHGLPEDADFVFDVRCLPNPYWDDTLRAYTGRDEAVKNFLEPHSQVQQMIDQIYTFFTSWIPQFSANNRSYLTLAIGCTGGQHRSVYVVEELSKRLTASHKEITIMTRHRELT